MALVFCFELMFSVIMLFLFFCLSPLFLFFFFFHCYHSVGCPDVPVWGLMVGLQGFLAMGAFY